MDTQTFRINGLHCEACTKLTAKRIKGLPGVADAAVDLHTGKAEVAANREIPLEEINTALSGSDYTAEEYHE
ncbi:MAG TPA: heavy metal-associated domain-containing protein [Candidatus Saccharimonadales bacterium]|nr:heavy metal-associated domain-containing protein [Candidatus Saccharimonadales bacterium]